ncbi:pentapeptide repeat-containing protein [Streptomyces sp. NPDC012510]|uniref:pentapeptide repeat-containing protein n=1 Tax=Streptomyces sp. NPDC012510 TaxID=3364838 RepID=UPI0036E44754
MMSSGTRKNWAPRAFPSDPQAAARLSEWIQEECEGGLDAIGLDLSNADLSEGVFSECWFIDAKLVNIKLIGADLYRSNAEGADFSGADLTRSSLVRVNLDDTVLRGAILDGADLVKASMYGTDASHASFRGAHIMGADLLDANLRGADLSHAVLQENPFRVTLDHRTILQGLSGTLFGPVNLFEEGVGDELGGSELEKWLNDRGGNVRVLSGGRGREG